MNCSFLIRKNISFYVCVGQLNEEIYVCSLLSLSLGREREEEESL